MRKSYIQIDGKLYEKGSPEHLALDKQSAGYFVMEDMKPYKSPIDGEIISSRSHHRAHMRKHGVIEVGNERLNRPATKSYQPSGIKEDLMRIIK